MDASALAASPALYPLALDAGRDALFFVRFDEAAYRAASFLDERSVSGNGWGEWVDCAQARRALSAERAARPLHFIFHAGHVGSTLLSRLLDAVAAVLPLREPLPLRALADGSGDRELLLRLWERGFPATEAVILKATSSAQRIAPDLLAARPEARAVLLNTRAEPYIATMLAGPNSAVDLNGHGPERHRRLGRFLSAPAPRPTTLGELAAMSWLAERLTQDDIATRFGDRTIAIDFDAMLAAAEETLRDVAAHFGLAAAPDRIATAAQGPVMMRYSKAPEHGYSPALRGTLLDEARRLYGEEIRRGLAWIERAGGGAHL
jgi:hypothetical protein